MFTEALITRNRCQIVVERVFSGIRMYLYNGEEVIVIEDSKEK